MSPDLNSVTQMIKALQGTGNAGLTVLIVALVVVVTAGGWLIWIQQQAMKRFEITAKAIENQLKAADAIRQENRAAIETQIKGADTLREETRKAQETAHKHV